MPAGRVRWSQTISFLSLSEVMGIIERLVGLVCTKVYENHPENFTFEFGNVPTSIALSVGSGGFSLIGESNERLLITVTS